ncbi:hypothetical protein J2782_004560 [Brucella pseudogrignonensis]|uniref:Uncharacterized protein n=1 Tax=Brucella pseudogrignonensis TaxID=419475 RepID=A0ABU1MFI0_9HYPH|nr:hypothetical protein [Brucella pseudogrignonensis]
MSMLLERPESSYFPKDNPGFGPNSAAFMGPVGGLEGENLI